MKFEHGTNFKLIDKKRTYIDKTVQIGNNVTIYENCRIENGTIIGDNVTIKQGCYISNTIIEDGAIIESTHSEGSRIGKNCQIGPFARLRPNAEILEGAKVGNFVEIKNAKIGKGTKVSHLAYVGDAELGENCNVGCGAIFVNYNGKIKQKTIVGDNCFIGSNCNVIAPVVIKDNTYLCAGTTLTEDTENDDFIIGRVRPSVKKNRAHEYLKHFKGE